MESLAGRTAFITGGAGGIGLAIALACAREGANVAIADINDRALEQARECLARSANAAAYRLDVTDRDAYRDVADSVEDELGPVSLLFNNAGVSDSVSPATMSYVMWDHVMGVNLTGVYNGIQTFVPRMIARGGGGHIVNTSSAAGLVVGGAGFLYHASKFAVVGLSEALREELAHRGIGVSVLCPGRVATDIVENTLKLRPAEAPATSSRVASILATMQEQLHTEGIPVDAVARMVVDAVKGDRLYIETDRTLEQAIRARCAALLAALP